MSHYPRPWCIHQHDHNEFLCQLSFEHSVRLKSHNALAVQQLLVPVQSDAVENWSICGLQMRRCTKLKRHTCCSGLTVWSRATRNCVTWWPSSSRFCRSCRDAWLAWKSAIPKTY